MGHKYCRLVLQAVFFGVTKYDGEGKCEGEGKMLKK